MSPTSYQAAPPRVSVIKVIRPACNVNSYLNFSRRARGPIPDRRPTLPGTASAAVPPAVDRVREPVQDLLVATHHPELLARDSLLHRPVGQDRLPDRGERIDRPPQRIDVVLQ